MFGIGMQELMIILVVALLVLGPTKLPEVARSIGKGLRELRRASDDLRTAIMVEDDERPRRQSSAAKAPPPDVPPAIHGSVVATAQKEIVARGEDEPALHEGPVPDDPAVRALLDEAKREAAAAPASAESKPDEVVPAAPKDAST